MFYVPTILSSLNNFKTLRGVTSDKSVGLRKPNREPQAVEVLSTYLALDCVLLNQFKTLTLAFFKFIVNISFAGSKGGSSSCEDNWSYKLWRGLKTEQMVYNLVAP